MPPTKGKVVAGLFNIKSKETKMTYQDLFNALSKMTPEQLQCDLTVEIVLDDGLNECFPAELKICGIEHGVLDEDHPVIFVGS